MALMDAILRLYPGCSQSPTTSVKATAISFMEAIFHNDFPSQNDQLLPTQTPPHDRRADSNADSNPMEDQSVHQDHYARSPA
jgi:hypothetical protein